MKPPAACPDIDPISQVAELIDAAAGNWLAGTICAIMAENVGPLKALTAPVAAITPQIQAARVIGENWVEACMEDK